MVKKKVSKKSAKKDFSFSAGLVAYIIGIVAIVEAIVSPVAGIVLGIIGLSFAKKENSTLSKRAKKINLIALVIGVLIFLAILIFTSFSAPIGGLQ